MTNTILDLDRVAEIQASAMYQAAAAKFLATAQRMVQQGKGWAPSARKVWISDLCAEMGTTVERYAEVLVAWNNLGLLQLTRADLVGAMDPAKVRASQIECQGSTFNFVVV